MSVYHFTAIVGVTILAEVEADSESEARKKLADYDMASVHPNDQYYHEEHWVCEELDGEPREIRLSYVEEGESLP